MIPSPESANFGFRVANQVRKKASATRISVKDQYYPSVMSERTGLS